MTTPEERLLSAIFEEPGYEDEIEFTPDEKKAGWAIRLGTLTASANHALVGVLYEAKTKDEEDGTRHGGMLSLLPMDYESMLGLLSTLHDHMKWMEANGYEDESLGRTAK